MSSMVLTETPSRTLTPVERAVLLTLAYSDVFDYPLTVAEIGRYLPVDCAEAEIEEALAALEGRHLSRCGDYVCLSGREATAEIRRRRSEIAARRWRAAEGFASWLRWVPFLGMVAVCGSQAVENAEADGDVDLFLVTAPGRLWIVQSVTMVLRRLGSRRFGIEICPNYLVSRERLEIGDPSLYLAREIAQAVPLFGTEDYERFLDANRWISRFLPRIDPGVRAAGQQRTKPRPTVWVEKLLGGRTGRRLDRFVYRTLLLYYRLRLKGRGWTKEDIEKAYRPDRQALVTGGFAGAVARRFLDRALEVLRAAEDDVDREELSRYFFGAGSEPTDSDPHFAGIFAARYGIPETS